MNYNTYDLELLAIVQVFKHWRHYLESSSYLIWVLTNHVNLRYFFITKKLNQQQAYQTEKLVVFDFYIKYHTGKKNPADSLSRHPDYDPAETHVGLLPTLQKKLGQGWKNPTLGQQLAAVTLPERLLESSERARFASSQEVKEAGTGDHEHLVLQLFVARATEIKTAYNLPSA